VCISVMFIKYLAIIKNFICLIPAARLPKQKNRELLFNSNKTVLYIQLYFTRLVINKQTSK